MTEKITLDYNEVATDNEKVYRGTGKTGGRLKTGWMKLRIVEAAQKTFETGTYGLDLVLKPVGENGELCPFRVWERRFLPLRNPTVDGHNAPKTGKAMRYFIRALDPTQCTVYTKTTEGTIVDENGNEVTKEQDQKRWNEVNKEIKRISVAMFNEPEMLEGQEFYGELTYEDTNDKFARLKTITNQPPEGVEVLTNDFIEELTA